MSDADQQSPALPLVPFPAPELVERARAFRTAGVAPVPAKPSATVLLLRDRAPGNGASDGDGGDPAGGVEVFMLRRRTTMAFAAGMYVFPGGVSDPRDGRCRGIDDTLVVTAIRETFEESGLLLAAGSVADPAALEADRIALLEHRASLGDVLERHGLTARPGLLRPWSRWVTPDFEPRRYDTRFLVAVAPAGQDARDTGGESDAAQWVAPAVALAALERREWLLMPPTEVTLRELVPFRRVAEVFEAAARRDVRPWQASIDLDADPPSFVFRSSP